MAKGLPRSLSRGSGINYPAKKLVNSVNETFTVDASSGVGFGSVPIGDLPEGDILVLGVHFQGELTLADGETAVVAADWEGDFSIGSTPVDDGTIGGDDADFIASTAAGAATDNVAAIQGQNATPFFLDNTDGSAEINFNALLDDAGSTTDGDDVAATVTGTLTVLYSLMGDD
jgi:hypothetical protein